MTPHTRHIKAISKLFRSCAYRHDLHSLFSDCMETIAITISNSVDQGHRDLREKRYLEIVGHYERNVVELFPRIFGEIVEAFETGPEDVLGAVYGELELISRDKGQFFTSYSVCCMMAEVAVSSRDHVAELIDRNGFVTAMEPACGAGAMVIALADVMHAHGINYQRHLHVTAVDVDPRAVHMAYIQFTLMHIPAIVSIGNSLSQEMREHWYTPAHILDDWSGKIARREAEIAALALIAPCPKNTGGSEPAITVGDQPPQLSLF